MSTPNKLVNQKETKYLKNRLKENLRPLISIINEEIRTFRNATRYVKELQDLLKSTAGDFTSVYTNQNGDRILFDDGEAGYNFNVELDMVGLNNFTITYRLGDAKSRYKSYNWTFQDVKDWIKDNLKDRKDERDKQPKINDKEAKVSEKYEISDTDWDADDTLFGTSRAKEAKFETQLDKANLIDKNAKEVTKEKNKGEDNERGMKDATKFKRQEDASTTNEPIAKGGKVSRKKEFPTDDEKTIKKVKFNNIA